jgi:hypothetical protein
MPLFRKTLLGFGAVVSLLIATLAATDVQAQQTGQVCDARKAILSEMKGSYSENPSAIGLASNGTVVEVLSSKDGTWTIIMTSPNGMSCLLAAGKFWQKVAAKAEGLPL